MRDKLELIQQECEAFFKKNRYAFMTPSSLSSALGRNEYDVHLALEQLVLKGFLLQTNEAEHEILYLNDQQRFFPKEEMKNDINLDSLTKREKDIFHYVAKGLPSKKIAETLFISEHTVKNHLTNILKKLHLRDRIEIITRWHDFSQNK